MKFLFPERWEEFLNQLNNISFHEKFSTVESHIVHTSTHYNVFETFSENFILVVVATVN
jgi:hypothetical protein